MKGGMSAFGTKRTSPVALHVSAFGGKADMATVRKLLALVMAAADMYRRHVVRSCSPSAPRGRRLPPWPTAG